MDQPEEKTAYAEVAATSVTAFYVKNAIEVPGKEIVGWKVFFDPNKDTFIFRLKVKDKK